MGMYRRVWTCLVAVAGVVGLWAAILVWSVGGAVFFFLFVGVSVTCVRLLMAKEDQPPPWRHALWAGLAAGGVVVPAGGLVSRLGLPGLVAVVLLVLFSPAVLALAADRSRRHRAPLAPPALSGDPEGSAGELVAAERAVTPGGATGLLSLLDAPWMKPPAESMDDATLCFAWRTSYVALQRPLPPSSTLLIVQRRQEFLDELERRNSRGFSAWLASGARAAGDPTRYIAGSSERPKDHHDRR